MSQKEEAKMSRALAQVHNDENNNPAQKVLLECLVIRPVFSDILPRAYAYAMLQVLLHQSRGELEELVILSPETPVEWEALTKAKLKLGDVLPLLAEIPTAETMVSSQDPTCYELYVKVGQKLLNRTLSDEQAELGVKGTGYLVNLSAGLVGKLWETKDAKALEAISQLMAMFVAEYLNAVAPGLIDHVESYDAFFDKMMKGLLMDVVEHPETILPSAYNRVLLTVLFPTIPDILDTFTFWNQIEATSRQEGQGTDYRVADAGLYHYALSKLTF